MTSCVFILGRYNDVPVVYDEAIYKRLRDADIDHLLAQHIAHLFIRDTVSLFGEKIHQDDEKESDHFEVIQVTKHAKNRTLSADTPDKVFGSVKHRKIIVFGSNYL